MFADYVFEKSTARYADKILLLDDAELNAKADYLSAFSAHGFEAVIYIDDLDFRIKYEKKLDTAGVKLAVVAHSDMYIPYDILKKLSVYTVSAESLFPRLNAEIIGKADKTELDLLAAVCPTNFDDLRSRRDTEAFLRSVVYESKNVKAYIAKNVVLLIERAKATVHYSDWFDIAEQKARLDLLGAEYDIEADTQEINHLFLQFVLAHFGKLSQNIDKSSPLLVSKAMEYMHGRSDKFVVIVMDGMSEPDWQVISTSFASIRYEKTSMFAMLPSTTSISRRCLLSGKYPSQLEEPWKQSREKADFINCAKSLGYSEAQIGYERGYDAQFGAFVRCGAVIINDVDDLVHAQTQGRVGMLNDVKVMANRGKLRDTVMRFLSGGYDVYITADHGNTPCVGLGKLVGTGVELETKSRRAIVLKSFADKDALTEKYGLIEYPKYYLPKEYDYLFCNVGNSFDSKGDNVMTHGGITADEVIVPFIKIKAVQDNG